MATLVTAALEPHLTELSVLLGNRYPLAALRIFLDPHAFDAPTELGRVNNVRPHVQII